MTIKITIIINMVQVQILKAILQEINHLIEST